MGRGDLHAVRRGGNRSEQLALIAGLLHDRGTDPRIAELLAELEGSDLLADPDVTRGGQRPRAFAVNTTARSGASPAGGGSGSDDGAGAEGVGAAREGARFATFRPWLEKIVELKRAEAECVGYQNEPYDALIDDYEPGLSSAVIARLFEALRRDLVPLAERIAEARRQPDVGLCDAISRAAPAGLRRPGRRGGRLRPRPRAARSGRPPICTSIGPGDCRITARFDDRDFAGGVLRSSTRPDTGSTSRGSTRTRRHPDGRGLSVGMDESQARFWENRIGRSRGFWEYFFPLARDLFPESLDDVACADFLFALNRVSPSLIRTNADEVTYNLHILVRFELERALVSGDLRAADVPEAWNEAYRRTLGITPANDAEGCLQDGHWADGLLGYFPTYTLGDVFAAQLFAQAEHELGDLDEQLARGDCALWCAGSASGSTVKARGTPRPSSSRS